MTISRRGLYYCHSCWTFYLRINCKKTLFSFVLFIRTRFPFFRSLWDGNLSQLVSGSARMPIASYVLDFDSVCFDLFQAIRRTDLTLQVVKKTSVTNILTCRYEQAFSEVRHMTRLPLMPETFFPSESPCADGFPSLEQRT